MEATELRRSTLERKDRDELVTIATALGSKPPSKARKAEIVDLIIKTATTEGGGDDGEGDDAKKATKGSSKAKKADSKDAKDDGEGDDAGTYHAGDDEEFDFGEVTTKKGGRNNKNNAKGNNSGGDNKGNDCLLYTSDAADE